MFQLLHFIAITVILLFMVYFLYLDHKNQKANLSYPSLLITIGIGFTFFGVALGLMDFNTDDPTASLATLVNGIKTAFWGSFTGVFASIILKFHALLFLKENDAELKGDEQLKIFYQEHTTLVNQTKLFDKIYESINQNNNNLIQAILDFGVNLDQKNKMNMAEMLTSINSSLNGIEQIQRSTQGHIAGEISELRSEFVMFAQKQAEMNTDIFIQALETVIQRFNDNLTDSLGENFRQLNQSVNRLVEWQDKYANQIEQQTDKYHAIVEQVEQVKNAFSDILRNTDIFNSAIQQMEIALESIDYKNAEFNQRIESFYGGLDAKIIDIENTRQLMEKGFNSLELQLNQSKQLSEQIFSEINSFLTDSHNNALNSQKQSLQHAQQMREHMNVTFNQTQKQLSDGLSTIETKLQQTLNQSLITLAQQLGSLSTKFAQDYEPITVNLKRVIDSIDRGVR